MNMPPLRLIIAQQGSMEVQPRSIPIRMKIYTNRFKNYLYPFSNDPKQDKNKSPVLRDIAKLRPCVHAITRSPDFKSISQGLLSTPWFSEKHDAFEAIPSRKLLPPSPLQSTTHNKEGV